MVFYLTILVLYIIWFVFWYLYNFYGVPKGITTEKRPIFFSILYCVLTCLILIISGASAEIIANILTFFLVILLINASKKGEDMWCDRLSNSAFQMTWLFSFVSLVNHNAFLLAVIFFIGHLPILFAKVSHIKLATKTIVLALSGIGGIVPAFLLIRYYPLYGLTLATVIHYMTYFYFLSPLDNKYKLNIIN